MTTRTVTTVEAVAAIAEGRVLTAATRTAFALVARRQGRYEIECGWVVPEAYDDDYSSSSYHPFEGDRVVPWVGRRAVTSDPTEARDLYLAAKAAVFGADSTRRHVFGSDAIGSVSRSPAPAAQVRP